MDVYVMTRGLQTDPDQDYHWERITGNNQIRVRPPLQVEKYNNTIDVNDLIHTQDFSLALARNGVGIFLLVTGLSSQFKDFSKTPIRNSICWLATNPDEELTIRGLAVKFLQEKKKIEDKIKECITRHPNGSFQVDIEKISNVNLDVDTSRLNQEPLSAEELGTTEIVLNSDDNRRKLAEQITRYSLPNNQGVLVIVTTKKEDRRLEQAGVWRGLTNIVSGDIPPKHNPWNELIELFQRIQFHVIFLVILPLVIVSVITIVKPNSSPPPDKPAITISYKNQNLNLEVRLLNQDIDKLYYRGGFSEDGITAKLEGIPINSDNFFKIFERIDGPNPSKLNTTYKYIVSDRQIDDQEVRQLFHSPPSSGCLSKADGIIKYPVTICITTEGTP